MAKGDTRSDPEEVPAIPPGWRTLAVAAKGHGAHYMTIKRWIALGRIRHRWIRLPSGVLRGRRTAHIVSESDVVRALARTNTHAIMVGAEPGHVAARAFRMLNAGASLRELVVKLGITPGVAKSYTDQWRKAGDPPLEIGADARQRLTILLGPFASVAELVRRVAELADAAGELAQKIPH